MMRKTTYGFIIVAVLCMWAAASYGQDLKFVELGDFRLENGETIRDCRLGYRTFGVLNHDKSNAVLFPTWLAGTSGELADLGFIGPGKLADTEKYFVIAVDAFGNGVSSSPSNSKLQPEGSFPRFSIGDMVNAQHLLVSRHFGLSKLRAAIGISMGAMQVFQWMVSHPDFLCKAVPVSGTPRQTAYDLLVWQAELGIIDALKSSGKYSLAMKAVAAIHTVLARTPDYYASQIKRQNFLRFIADNEKALSGYDPCDWASQLLAMMNHNIYKTFNDSPGQAAKTVKAQALIITSSRDHLVYPGPSRELAGLLDARLFELTGDCGHFAFFCEQDKILKVAADFLEK